MYVFDKEETKKGLLRRIKNKREQRSEIIMNNELPRTKIDEKTGIEYHLEGDYYIPNLTIPKQEKIILNKYGRMRLNYLKEHKKAEYSTMLMDGTLNSHLKEIQNYSLFSIPLHLVSVMISTSLLICIFYSFLISFLYITRFFSSYIAKKYISARQRKYIFHSLIYI